MNTGKLSRSAAMLAAGTMAFTAYGDPLTYRLDATTSTGVDLTAMEGYYHDRMEGPLSSDVYFSGPLTVDPSVSAENPFQLIGNGKTIRINGAGSGLHTTPLKLYNAAGMTGQTRLMFQTASGGVYSGASLDIGRYNKLYFDIDKGHVKSSSVNVHDGGNIYGRTLIFGEHIQSAISVSSASIDADYGLRLGNQTASVSTPVTSFLGVTNSTITVKAGAGISDQNVKGGLFMVPDVVGSSSENCRIVIGTGGLIKAPMIVHHGGGHSRILFDGGKYQEQTSTTYGLFHVYGHTYSGSWPSPQIYLEGINGNPIDIEIASNRNLASGSSGSSRRVNLTGTGGFTKRGAGTLTLNRLNATSTCDCTGPTTILGGGLVVTDSVFKPGRGDLAVSDGAFLDLAGFDAEFAAATGAGIVSNSAATVSTLTLGYGNANAAFSIAIGERINVVKTGTGTLTVSGTALANECDFTIEAGTVVFTGDSSTYGTVTVKSGATLDITGTRFSCEHLITKPGSTLLPPPATIVYVR